jgi:hypothetical protein
LQGIANNLRGTPTAGSRWPTVSPPWSGNRTGNNERFLSNEGARMPRGAYAPRSWWFCGADVCRRNCDLCDIRTLVYKSGEPSARRGVQNQPRPVRTERCPATSETTAKSSGREPAVARETHLPVRFRKVAGVCQRCDDELRCSRGSESTGADAPRSWWFCGVDTCRRNCDLCDIRTLVYKSGDPQPAVVR